MYAPRRGAAALIATVAASAALAAAAPAYASGGADDHGGRARHGGASAVRSSSSCATGVVRLKAKHDDARIEVEAEVDTNRNGQRWSVRLVDNGHTVWRGKRITHAPSGSFSIEKRIADRRGKDVITVRVARGRTVCSTRVTV